MLEPPFRIPFVLTSPFNAPRSYGLHEGADYDVTIQEPDSKEPVLCMYPGVVHLVETTPGYGNKVVVKHSRNGSDFYTWYAHLDAIYVSVGDAVIAGKYLGELGSTGNSTGEHVHINLQVPGFGLDGYIVDDVVDPDPYIKRVASGGSAMLGIHASADSGDIQEVEFNEFNTARAEVVKVLSSHSGASVGRLATQTYTKAMIIRAFLHFGGRAVTPQQFFDWTKDDVLRALQNAGNNSVILELHNEPNLAQEGLFSAWSDGIAFGAWLNSVATLFRGLQSNLQLMYPGLSPGGSIPGIRQDHVSFIEQSRSAVNGMDALAVHVYWSDVYPMSNAIAVLDDYIARFPGKDIWVTEASHNKAGPTVQQKGQQYVQFWQALKQRPTVKGVTYFVASASNQAWQWPNGSCETWVQGGASLGIGSIVGTRT